MSVYPGGKPIMRSHSMGVIRRIPEGVTTNGRELPPADARRVGKTPSVSTSGMGPELRVLTEKATGGQLPSRRSSA